MLRFGRGDSNIVYKCTVRLLEDPDILECEYKPNQKGKVLLEHICQQLNVAEVDYFGLRYVDAMDQRQWLDLGKSVSKQVKDLDPVVFCFRVKFYPPDPFRLKEDITRYHVFLQLKRDLRLGRLYCTLAEEVELAACILQADIGEYNPEVHVGNYASLNQMLLEQSEPIEEKIMEAHQRLKGQSTADAEKEFIQKAIQLDTYGVDPHPVKLISQDPRRGQLYLGINYKGILTFQGSKKTHLFRWADIQKINYEGRMLIFHVTYNERKHTIGFKCPTGVACKYVWRCAMEQMLFFTLASSSDAPSVVSGGGLFSWGTRFKYVGRTEREIWEDSSPSKRNQPSVQRRKASSVPATPSTPLQTHLGYSSLPRSSHSDVGGSRIEPSTSAGLLSALEVTTQNLADGLETVTEDQETALRRRNNISSEEQDQISVICFRDSFEHSSSESQLVDGTSRGVELNTSHRSSRSQTPLPTRAQENRVQVKNSTPKLVRRKPWWRRNFLKILGIATAIFFIGIFFMFESNYEFFENCRSNPNIKKVKSTYWEPFKDLVLGNANRMFCLVVKY